MDQLSFLNFFVYLTDITPESRPHCLGAPYHIVPAAEPLQLAFGEALREYPRTYSKFVLGQK